MTVKERTHLRCPHCGADKLQYVIESRGSNGMVRRRRQCQNCWENATTLELVVSKDLRLHTPEIHVVQEVARGKCTDPDYPNALVTFP